MTSLIIALVLSCPGNPNCACGHDKEQAQAAPAKGAAPAKEAAKPAAGDVIARGEKLKGLAAVQLDKVLATPADFDGKTIAVEGKVRRACEKKGCWMELAASDKGPGMRVTFKDYGFFVPLDSAGATAKVEGTVKVAELTEANAKHLQAEGATVPTGKDGKAREVQLVALGVELRK